MSKSLGSLGAYFILILMVILSALTVKHYVTPLYCSLNNAAWVENILTARLNQPVHIGHLATYWKGFEPFIEIDDFSITDEKGAPKLEVKKVQVGLDLFASLVKWKPLPADLALEGTHLILKPHPNGKIDINDIPALQADIYSKHSEKLCYLIDCFLTSGVKHLKNVDVSLYDTKGRLVVPLTHLFLTMDSKTLAHAFSGQANLWSQSPIHFQGNVKGSFLVKNLSYTKGHMDIHHIRLPENPLIQAFLKKFSLKEGVADLATDFTLAPRHKFGFSGKLSTEGVTIETPLHRRYVFNPLNTQFLLNYQYSTWSLWLNNLQTKLGNQRLPIHTLYFMQTPHAQLFKVDQLPLKEAASFITDNGLLSLPIREAIGQLKPSGFLENLSLQYKEGGAQFQLAASLKQVNFQRWASYPGIENLNGQLQLGADHGKFTLDASHSIFNYSPMFRYPIPIERATGVVTWQAEAKTFLDSTKTGKPKEKRWMIDAKNLNLMTPSAQAMGYVKLEIPAIVNQSKIAARFNFKASDTREFPLFYPVTVLPKSVVTWLDGAIKGGKVEEGNLILEGKLKEFPFDNGQGKFIINANLQHGKLHYRDKWPDLEHLRAHLHFRGRSMAIISHHASLVGAKVKYVTAKIANLEKALLEINGQIHHLQASPVLFNSTNNPLSLMIKDTAYDHLNIAGHWQLGLHLSIPLEKESKNPVKFTGSMKFDDVNLTAPDSPLAFNGLKGDLIFREDSAEATSLTGRFLNHPFQLTMASHPSKLGKLTEMHLKGQIEVSDVKKLVHQKCLDFINGQTQYQAYMSFLKPMNGSNKYTLKIQSDLKGIASTLPPPFNKARESVVISSFKWEEDDPFRRFEIHYGNIAASKLSYKKIDKTYLFDRGVVQLSTHILKPVLPFRPGLSIEGNLTEFNGLKWKELVNPTNDHGKESLYHFFKKLPVVLQHLKLHINHLVLPHLNLNDVTLNALSSYEGLSLSFDSTMAKGTIKFPMNFPSLPIKIGLQSLSVSQDLSAMSHGVLPTDIPPLDINIGNLYFKRKSLTNISLQLRPYGHNLLIKQLSVKEPFFQLTASGAWQKAGNRQVTLLQGNFNTTNLGNLLHEWKFTDNMVRGEGTGRFNLAWPDSPWHPKAKSLKGNMDLHFTQGRITKLGHQANFGMDMGRILTLFSLQTLPRRLMLDFSDLIEPGFSFDEMKGCIQFKEGSILAEHASMDGPVAKVRMHGRIGLENKDYDLKLTINPYVTSSLPVVATLTAGPIVGAATWLIDKLFSHQVKQMTEIHYNVTGKWDKPTVNNDGNF